MIQIENIDFNIILSVLQLILNFYQIKKARKNNPVLIAIRKTEEKYSDIEKIEETLESMFKNNELAEEIKSILNGKDYNFNLKKLSEIFIKKYFFYFANQTKKKANEIIFYFLTSLAEEFLRTEDSTIILARKIDDSKQQTISKLNQLLEKNKIDNKLIKKFIDEIRELINLGQVITAKKLLASLLEDTNNISNFMLFRIYTNLGACELYLDNIKDAAIFFEKAFTYNKNDKKSLLNLGLAYQLKGIPEEGLIYVNKVLNKEKNDIDAIVRKASLLLSQKDFKTAINLFKDKNKIKTYFLGNLDSLSILGEIFYEQENYKEAIKYFDKARKVKNFYSVIINIDIRMKLALSILKLLMKEIPYFPNYLNHIEIEKMNRAENFLTEAIKLTRKTELENFLKEALEKRSSLRFFLNNYEGSEKDCEELAEIEVDNIISLENRAYIASSKKDFDSAISYFNKLIKRRKEIGEKKFYQILSNILKSHFNKTPLEELKIKEIIDNYSGECINDDRLLFEVSIIEYFLFIKDFDNAKIRLQKIKDKFPENVEVNKINFKFLILSGQAINIEEEYLKLSDNSKSKRELVFLIADFFKNNGIYDKAIFYYEKIIDTDVIDYNLEDYIYCLLKSSNKPDSYNKIIEICSKLRTKFGILEKFSEIEADICMELQNLNEAIDLYTRVLKKDPNNKFLKLKIIFAEFRKGINLPEIVRKINNIKYDFFDSPKHLMAIAEILNINGEIEESIKIAYLATINKLDDPRINLTYIMLVLSCEKSEFLSPKIVGIDSIIKTKFNSEDKILKLIDSNVEKIKETNQFYKDSDIGKLLLGKRIGDTLNFDGNIIEITALDSKYVKLFQEIIDNFDLKFDDENGLKKIRIDDNFKEKFLTIIDDRSKKINEIINLYKENKCTLGLVSSLTGRDIFDTWEAFIFSDKLKLKCSRGNLEQEEKEINYINGNDSILIDIIGLFTLKLLNIIELIPKIFFKVYLNQFTLDEINRIIWEKQKLIRSGGYSIFSKYEDRFIISEITEDILKEKINFLESIKNFIINYKNVELLGIKNYSRLLDKKYLESFGNYFVNTIVTAKENKLVLYSDDLVLRELAFKEDNIVGVNIQPILKKFLLNNIISRSQYFDHLIELIKKNYYFISIEIELFIHILEKNKYDPKDNTFKRVLERLETKDNLLNPVIEILGKLIKFIFTKKIQIFYKNIFLTLILSTIIKRGGYQAINLLEKYLNKIFKLDPINLLYIKNFIELRKRTNKILNY